jgi:hypothetical protein
MAPEARIPAWKRLGLKLVGSKRPAEDALPEDNSQQTATDSKTGGKSHRSKKRKSVGFSTDSKLKDGSTTQHLLDGFISAQQGGNDQFTLEEASLFAAKAQSRPKKQKVKPHAKGKKPRAQKQPSDPEQPSYVDYLVRFHTDKEHWKFNKVRQNQLLKHVFDTDAPLTEHMEALVAYMEGLQGNEARNRLRTTALEIAGLSDAAKETLHQELLNVKVRMREAADVKEANSPVGRTKLENRELALRILIALENNIPLEMVPNINLFKADMDDEPNQAHTARLSTRVIEVNTPDGPVLQRKRARIRKIRTGHPDDDEETVSSIDSVPNADNTTSSSSESSEESSSEEEEESSEEESSEAEASPTTADENMAEGGE